MRMHRSKIIGSVVVVVVVDTKIVKSRHLNKLSTKQKLSILSKSWLQCAQNRVALPASTSITNSVLLLTIVATPIDRAHVAYA